MSNFDNFDIHQMSPKFAQRWHFFRNLYCKKISILGSLDYAKIAKRLLENRMTDNTNCRAANELHATCHAA